MLDKHSLKSASEGDLLAISKLIGQSLKNNSVSVTAEMQYGVTLWLKLKSEDNLDPQTCLQAVIEVLNQIKPAKVNSARITQVSITEKNVKSWDKFIAFKNGTFVDNTKASEQLGYFFLGGIILVFAIPVFYSLGSTLFGNKTVPVVVATSPAMPSQLEQEASAALEQEASAAIDSKTKTILENITKAYGFSRFIDTWGMGTQGLFLPEDAWKKLSESDKNTLIQYSKNKKFRGIVVGKLLSKNNISIDDTVWGE
jgi:hypothetical protein